MIEYLVGDARSQSDFLFIAWTADRSPVDWKCDSPRINLRPGWWMAWRDTGDEDIIFFGPATIGFWTDAIGRRKMRAYDFGDGYSVERARDGHPTAYGITIGAQIILERMYHRVKALVRRKVRHDYVVGPARVRL